MIEQIRSDLAEAMAREELRPSLRAEMMRSVLLFEDVKERSRIVHVAIGLVPDRLAELEANATPEVRRVLDGIWQYWRTPVDIVPDERGLVGRVDDALVVHALFACLNPNQVPKVDARRMLVELLSDETIAAVDAVVTAIWEGVFDPASLTPLDPATPIFALEGAREFRYDSEKVRDPETEPRLYEVWYGTNRKPVKDGFGDQRDDSVHHGVCEVAIPKAHKFGSIGTAWYKRWIRLDFADDRIRVQARRPLDGPDEFFADLREGLADSTGKQVLFYLHGYNVTFDEAAIRAAQLFADLKIDGAAAFFSWPSKASVKDYFADVARIEESERAIADFLSGLCTALGGATVHIIAHSMANRGLARAIQRITATASEKAGVRFGQIILAAPDISVGLFQDLAAVYPKISQRTTMYVSARDRALGMSQFLQDAPRAGFTPPVTVVPDIDTIEVTNIDVTMLGHGYYAAAEPILRDIDNLLRHNEDPAQRLRLQRGPEAAQYWVIGQ
ncbi:alpha/beta hydrolase [Lentzea sp. NPDC005914]|uniref:alpha/beta hydrolase n=1 Tax=Lentzea sp. NPDC005914 TaxID=3154572 RepID=UPI0033F5F925